MGPPKRWSSWATPSPTASARRETPTAMVRRPRGATAGRSRARLDRCRQCRHRRQSDPERRRRSVHRAELAVALRSRRPRQAGRAVGDPAAGQQRHQRQRHARHAKGSRDAGPDHRRHADAHRTGTRAGHRDLGRHDASARRRAEAVCDDCRGHRRAGGGEHWIRTSGAFDAVIDFERVMRDPERPDRLLPAFDSGDHLHPNDAGYRAMAAAVDLRRFAP